MTDDEPQREDETDETLKICCDCGGQFIFTSGERDFLLSRGLSERKRCVACVNAKRLHRQRTSEWA